MVILLLLFYSPQARNQVRMVYSPTVEKTFHARNARYARVLRTNADAWLNEIWQFRINFLHERKVRKFTYSCRKGNTRRSTSFENIRAFNDVYYLPNITEKYYQKCKSYTVARFSILYATRKCKTDFQPKNFKLFLVNSNTLVGVLSANGFDQFIVKIN